MIQIIEPTGCNSFTSLLLDVYVWLNVFWASPRPSSGAYNCTRSLWFNCCSPTVKPETPSAVVCAWWWAGRRPKHVEPHINSSNKLVKLLHLVGWIIWIVWWCTDLRMWNPYNQTFLLLNYRYPQKLKFMIQTLTETTGFSYSLFCKSVHNNYCRYMM